MKLNAVFLGATRPGRMVYMWMRDTVLARRMYTVTGEKMTLFSYWRILTMYDELLIHAPKSVEYIERELEKR